MDAALKLQVVVEQRGCGGLGGLWWGGWEEERMVKSTWEISAVRFSQSSSEHCRERGGPSH